MKTELDNIRSMSCSKSWQVARSVQPFITVTCCTYKAHTPNLIMFNKVMVLRWSAFIALLSLTQSTCHKLDISEPANGEFGTTASLKMLYALIPENVVGTPTVCPMFSPMSNNDIKAFSLVIPQPWLHVQVILIGIFLMTK